MMLAFLALLWNHREQRQFRTVFKSIEKFWLQSCFEDYIKSYILLLTYASVTNVLVIYPLHYYCYAFTFKRQEIHTLECFPSCVCVCFLYSLAALFLLPFYLSFGFFSASLVYIQFLLLQYHVTGETVMAWLLLS